MRNPRRWPPNRKLCKFQLLDIAKQIQWQGIYFLGSSNPMGPVRVWYNRKSMKAVSKLLDPQNTCLATGTVWLSCQQAEISDLAVTNLDFHCWFIVTNLIGLQDQKSILLTAWNRLAIISLSWDEWFYGLAAAILNFILLVSRIELQVCSEHCWTQKYGCSHSNFVSISSMRQARHFIGFSGRQFGFPTFGFCHWVFSMRPLDYCTP